MNYNNQNSLTYSNGNNSKGVVFKMVGMFFNKLFIWKFWFIYSLTLQILNNLLKQLSLTAPKIFIPLNSPYLENYAP